MAKHFAFSYGWVDYFSCFCDKVTKIYARNSNFCANTNFVLLEYLCNMLACSYYQKTMILCYMNMFFYGKKYSYIRVKRLYNIPIIAVKWAYMGVESIIRSGSGQDCKQNRWIICMALFNYIACSPFVYAQ